MELSADLLELLRKDDEFLLCRDKPSSVPFVAPVSARPAFKGLRDIEHEYLLKHALDAAWAARPAAALGGPHKKGLIRTGVNAGEVRLAGFGFDSRLRRERQAPVPPEFIAGTLPYLTPEQTGPMNRAIDWGREPMEWVHCHVARQPEPAGERLEHIPSRASAIIWKLLARVAEVQYLAAAGAANDLRRFLAQ